MEFETKRRLDEVQRVGVGFNVPSLAPKLMSCSKCSKISEMQEVEVAA
jgi:hypothetical protein